MTSERSTFSGGRLRAVDVGAAGRATGAGCLTGTGAGGAGFSAGAEAAAGAVSAATGVSAAGCPGVATGNTSTPGEAAGASLPAVGCFAAGAGLAAPVLAGRCDGGNRDGSTFSGESASAACAPHDMQAR